MIPGPEVFPAPAPGTSAQQPRPVRVADAPVRTCRPGKLPQRLESAVDGSAHRPESARCAGSARPGAGLRTDGARNRFRRGGGAGSGPAVRRRPDVSDAKP